MKRYDSQKQAEENYRRSTDNSVLNRRNYKSKAKKFIKDFATQEELKELIDLIQTKLK